jgi:hypothetical protein
MPATREPATRKTPATKRKAANEIREEGARYVVEEVREAEGGGFYRALGEIKRLDP